MRISRIRLRSLFWALPYLAFLLLTFYHFDFILDDPFISFRYARNLLQGHGLVFNVGERVEGYSNFLWIMLLAPFMRLGCNPVLVSKILGIVFGLLTIYCTSQISLLIFAAHTMKRQISFLSSCLAGFSWYFCLWSIGGLETTLFSFLIALSVYELVQSTLSGSHTDWSFIPLALAGMTRPETPLLFAAFLLVKLYFLIVKDLRFRSLLIWGVGFTLVYGSYFAWRLIYYGQLLPNSYYAKTLGGPRQYLEGARYARDFLTSQGHIYLLILAFCLIGLVRLVIGSRNVRLVLFLLLVYLTFIIYAGGDWMGGFRFLAQIFPLFGVLLASSLTEFAQCVTRGAGLSRYANLTLLVLASALIGSSLQGSAANLRQSIPWLTNWYKRLSLSPAGAYYDVGQYLKYNVPEGSWVALGEAGMIPYYAENIKVIDILGLMDLHIARIHGLLHEKGDAAYVLSRNPDYVLALAQEDREGTMRYAAEPMRQFFDNRRFQEQYRLVFKLARGSTGELKDMFYLYSRSDLPELPLDGEVAGFIDSNVRLVVKSPVLISGRDTLYLHVINMNAPAIDILYTIDAKHMPILHAWPLDANHTASAFVSADTAKGVYVFEAIRDARDKSTRNWIHTNATVVVK